MTNQKSNTKSIARKVTVWGLLLLSLPPILLGEPGIRIFGLIVAGTVIIWDAVAASNRKTIGHTHQTTIESLPSENTHPSPVVLTPKVNDSIVLPKRPVLIITVIILVIAAYSLGYTTGKNTAVRLSAESAKTAR